jgi:hypothetical protein
MFFIVPTLNSIYIILRVSIAIGNNNFAAFVPVNFQSWLIILNFVTNAILISDIFNRTGLRSKYCNDVHLIYILPWHSSSLIDVSMVVVLFVLCSVPRVWRQSKWNYYGALFIPMFSIPHQQEFNFFQFCFVHSILS